jgi:DNA-binding IclR family transcriptional regulator
VNQEKIEQDYPRYSEKDLWDKIQHRRRKGYVAHTVLEVARAKAVAVPLHTSFETAASVAISISAVDERLDADRVKEVSALLLDTAAKIESEIRQLLR